MKLKILFSVIALTCTLAAKAQFYGIFGYGDPDAWFDKEIYFPAKMNIHTMDMVKIYSTFHL